MTQCCQNFLLTKITHYLTVNAINYYISSYISLGYYISFIKILTRPGRNQDTYCDGAAFLHSVGVAIDSVLTEQEWRFSVRITRLVSSSRVVAVMCTVQDDLRINFGGQALLEHFCYSTNSP